MTSPRNVSKQAHNLRVNATALKEEALRIEAEDKAEKKKIKDGLKQVGSGIGHFLHLKKKNKAAETITETPQETVLDIPSEPEPATNTGFSFFSIFSSCRPCCGPDELEEERRELLGLGRR